MATLKLATMQAAVKSPFLEGLAPQESNAVLSAASKRRYRAGAVVSYEGTPADYFFMLARGRARFSVLTPEGKKILLMWLPEGEVFGVAAMPSRAYNYIVSTEMVRDSTILIWDKATIRRLARRYPQLTENLIDTSIQYLTFYAATHVALSSHTASQRVARILRHLAEGIGRPVSSGLELDITNDELAQAANVTHFTTSRLLSDWQRKHALIKTRGKIILRSPARLSLNVA